MSPEPTCTHAAPRLPTVPAADSPIVLALDRSTEPNIHLSRSGAPVSLEEAFESGFVVTRDDANAVLELIQKFLTAREHFQK